jgi:hypothetical protein
MSALLRYAALLNYQPCGITSSIKNLLAPGNTSPAKRLIIISTSPIAKYLLRGQMMVLKTSAIVTLWSFLDLDMGACYLNVKNTTICVMTDYAMRISCCKILL